MKEKKKLKGLLEGLDNALSILKLFYKELIFFALIYTAIVLYPIGLLKENITCSKICLNKTTSLPNLAISEISQ